MGFECTVMGLLPLYGNATYCSSTGVCAYCGAAALPVLFPGNLQDYEPVCTQSNHSLVNQWRTRHDLCREEIDIHYMSLRYFRYMYFKV